MVGKYRIVSADAHILEPPHIWATWLPKKHQEKAPKLVKDVDGGDAWLFAGATDPDPIGLVATPGMPYDQFQWTGVTYQQAREGCYSGKARLSDMDYDGVDAELLFAPQRTIGHFLGDEDDDFVQAGVDAYNNFLREEFCAPDPSRLFGVGQIPSIGIDASVRALGKLRDDGFKSVAISNWPAGGDAASDEDDRFWAAAEEMMMPVCIHINVISRQARLAARRAASRTGNQLYGEKSRKADPAVARTARASAKAIAGLGSVFASVPSTISQLIFTGVFERFPLLHVSMIETGVGWIPHFLEQMDDRYWRNRSWGDLPISKPPSHYWFSNMSATFIVDRNGIDNRYGVGLENMMWSTDYPHHGNDWPYSRKVIMDMMGHIDPHERSLICGENAVRIFGLGQQ